MTTKKVFSFLLLAIFSFNIVGYFITFKVVQHQIKREIKSTIKLGLKTSELTAIQINKKDLNELVWEEKNKEFHYKGELYDIVKTEENSQYIIYYCINDKQEEQLFANLDEHIKTCSVLNNTNEKNSAKKSINPLVKLYFATPLNSSVPIDSKHVNHLDFSDRLPSLLFQEIDSPPPELV